MKPYPYVPKLRRNDMTRHRSGPLKTTTIEIPEPLYARVKLYARQAGIPLRSLHTQALTEYLDAAEAP